MTPGVWWKTRHLIVCRRWSKCLLCQIILLESEGAWLYYILVAWGMMEYGLIHG